MAKRTGYTTQQLTILQFGNFAEQQRRDMAGIKASMANIKAERASQKVLQDRENKFVVDQYAKVGELKETGGATFDTNKDAFFNDQIDKYIKIKNGIDNGSVTADVGGKALAKINDQIQAYKDAAPQILAQAKLIQEGMKIPAGEPGALSAVNSTVQQRILLDLIQGGDVRIIDNEGELVLFQPPGVDKDGKKTEGGMININELINLEASGVEYVRTVPDITNPLKASFTGIVGEKGKWNWSQDDNRFMTIETIKKDDREITTKTMTPDQRENIREAIYASKSLQPIIDNEPYMQSVWVDMMGEDDEWNPGDEDKVEKAKYWLAQKSIDDNAAEAGIKEIMSIGGKSGGGDGGGDGSDDPPPPSGIKSNVDNMLNNMVAFEAGTGDFTEEQKELLKGRPKRQVPLTKNKGKVMYMIKHMYPKQDEAKLAALVDNWYKENEIGTSKDKKWWGKESTKGTTSGGDPAGLGI